MSREINLASLLVVSLVKTLRRDDFTFACFWLIQVVTGCCWLKDHI